MTKLLILLCCAACAFAADPALTKEQAAAAAVRDLRDAQLAQSSTELQLNEQKTWVNNLAAAAQQACQAIGKTLGPTTAVIGGKQVGILDCIEKPKETATR